MLNRKSRLAALAIGSLFAANIFTGCAEQENKNAPPANSDTAKTHTLPQNAISQDKDGNTVYRLESFKLDSAKGLAIFNGRDIYQVDAMDYQIGGYWLQMTEEMDLKTGQMHVTGALVSKVYDENSDHYISSDDIVNYPAEWKDEKHTEYRLPGRGEFKGEYRTKLWRVSQIPVMK